MSSWELFKAPPKRGCSSFDLYRASFKHRGMLCTKCGLSSDLPRLRFGEYQCRECLRPLQRKYSADWYARNKEKARTYQAAYWAAMRSEQKERHRKQRAARKAAKGNGS